MISTGPFSAVPPALSCPGAATRTVQLPAAVRPESERCVDAAEIPVPIEAVLFPLPASEETEDGESFGAGGAACVGTSFKRTTP